MSIHYTVQQLATLAGISVRTLHHYDTIGLLKPAGRSSNRYSQVFACRNESIMPYTLQSNILGEVPCVFVDDAKEKELFANIEGELEVPTGLHGRQDVYNTMMRVAEKVVDALEPRNEEMLKHGLAVLHYQHGIFVFGRNIWEAFDNLERVESNAKVQLLSKLLD